MTHCFLFSRFNEAAVVVDQALLEDHEALEQLGKEVVHYIRGHLTDTRAKALFMSLSFKVRAHLFVCAWAVSKIKKNIYRSEVTYELYNNIRCLQFPPKIMTFICIHIYQTIDCIDLWTCISPYFSLVIKWWKYKDNINFSSHPDIGTLDLEWVKGHIVKKKMPISLWF